MPQHPTLARVSRRDRRSSDPVNVAVAPVNSGNLPFPVLPFPVGSTPFPNILIDRIMPELTDTEWRLLGVVCRQTLGFASLSGRGGRRTRDWLSHGQLKARTGRASAAVSRAVDGLVRRNLIEVRTEAGELLLTPPERRRCQGRLFFSLAPRLARTLQPDTPGVDNLVDNSERTRTGRSQKPDGTAFTEHRKAKTTKQSDTK